MEVMFKTWPAAQAVTPAPARAPRASGREKKMSRFEDKYIPNDKANGERTKQRYSNSTSYCSTHGYDINGYNIKPDHHSGNCTNRGEFIMNLQLLKTYWMESQQTVSIMLDRIQDGVGR